MNVINAPKISLRYWTCPQRNDALKVCNVFGIDFKDLFQKPMGIIPKPDVRSVIVWMLLKKYGVKHMMIAKMLGIDRTSVYFFRNRFKQYLEVDKEFRDKCELLGFKKQ